MKTQTVVSGTPSHLSVLGTNSDVALLYLEIQILKITDLGLDMGHLANRCQVTG